MQRNDRPFDPHWFLKNRYVQTILASNRIRLVGKKNMISCAEEKILDAGGGIRLQGFISHPRSSQSKGLVILIHGWEGSAMSTYIVSTGEYLFNRGYTIFRLNLRDHGDSHHLNEGFFWAILLDEVFEAVKQAAQMTSMNAFLAGFSLGGNFALRIARKCAEHPIKNLQHVVAVSPGLNPDQSTDAIDNDFLLRYYFIKKWRNSLRKKQELFPHRYRFGDLLTTNSVRKMTEKIISRYGAYADVLTYFSGYTLTGDALKDICLPTTIITSADDPIIPIDDFYRLVLPSCVRLIVHQFGGHNGFVESIPFRCWYEQKIDAIANGYVN